MLEPTILSSYQLRYHLIIQPKSSLTIVFDVFLRIKLGFSLLHSCKL